jgi:hypothetical protein
VKAKLKLTRGDVHPSDAAAEIILKLI